MKKHKSHASSGEYLRSDAENKDRIKLANMKMRSPFLIKISMCVIMLLFVCERVANAQEVAAEDVVPELTPDEEIPWEEAPKKQMPGEVLVPGEHVVPREHNMAVMLIQGASGNLQRRGSGFACKFKNREFIATNLHVIEGVTTIKVTSPTGKSITLSDQMIVSEESDICLIGIKGNFADMGIVPLEFMEDVVNGSKSGDEIICLGNSLGKEVITATEGKRKAVGELSIEIDVPAEGGSSGGPIIHRDSGKVIGLVAVANMDDVKSGWPDNDAENFNDSNDNDNQTSCSGLRVDAVKKWKSLKLSEFTKSSSDIANATDTLDNIYNFLTNKPQWREDKSLSAAWDNYEKFREGTDSKATTELKGTEEVDEFELLTARTTGIKRKSVAQADYDKARLSIIKALDWKVQAIQDMIKKSTPIGSRQIEAINRLKADSQRLADAIKRM